MQGDLPYPIAPQRWHFRQSIEYSLTANRAVLDIASRDWIQDRMEAHIDIEAFARVILPSGKNLSTRIIVDGVVKRVEYHITKSWADQFTVN